jgi:hypothetical protein
VTAIVIPLRLTGLFGENRVNVTSVVQVNGHLLAYSWRVLTAMTERKSDARDAKVRLLYDTCDVLLDAGLMLRAYEAWREVAWWQLDATEIGGYPSVESSEAVAA